MTKRPGLTIVLGTLATAAVGGAAYYGYRSYTRAKELPRGKPPKNKLPRARKPPRETDETEEERTPVTPPAPGSVLLALNLGDLERVDGMPQVPVYVGTRYEIPLLDESLESIAAGQTPHLVRFGQIRNGIASAQTGPISVGTSEVYFDTAVIEYLHEAGRVAVTFGKPGVFGLQIEAENGEVLFDDAFAFVAVGEDPPMPPIPERLG